MGRRKLLASLMILSCVGAHAQSVARAESPLPRLPGTDQSGHFRFDNHHTSASRLAARVGQSAARILAVKNHMGGESVVHYGPPSPECKAKPTDSGCP
jgi:hypothetical protein